ncbi:MAG: FAD-binding protein [Xenococcus sp. MO_188.B8]|nr:FAD-binding protein [Xenococcus sp. MO_188.B8]
MNLKSRLNQNKKVLEEAADDFGHIIHELPHAVLQAQCTEDIRQVILLAQKENRQVAARGQGHSIYGQAQAPNGYVIDLRSLNKIYTIEGIELDLASVWVEAGVTWKELLDETLKHGLMPPVLTDYLSLSVGGTLSVGGIGARSFQYGTQTDNVLELEVVTGKGEVKVCSPKENQDLFNSCRAGLGQFGVIAKARIPLIKAPISLFWYHALYSDLGQFLADQIELTSTTPYRFDSVEGFAVPNSKIHLSSLIPGFSVAGTTQTELKGQEDIAFPEAGKWLFMLEATKSFDSRITSDETGPLEDLEELSILPQGGFVRKESLYNYLNRLEYQIKIAREAGLWQVPHPWLDVLLPHQQAQDFIQKALGELTLENIGNGVILIYALQASKLKTPFFNCTDSETPILFGVLRNAAPISQLQEMQAHNELLKERAVKIDACFYPNHIPGAQ